MKVEITNRSKHPLPKYETIGSAGMDLHANLDESILLKPLERVLVKTGLLNLIPKNKPFTAIECRDKLIDHKKKITTYNHVGYWKDIGNHTDYDQAKIDLKFITPNKQND